MVSWKKKAVVCTVPNRRRCWHKNKTEHFRWGHLTERGMEAKQLQAVISSVSIANVMFKPKNINEELNFIHFYHTIALNSITISDPSMDVK
jgi:hypothetical protein